MPADRPRARAQRGFTLAEIAIAILVMSLLGVFGLSLLTNTQAAQRRAEAQRQLEEVRSALIGFAITNGRLPCPAVTASNGQESFVAGGTTEGRCTALQPNAATQGLLPGRALGLPGVSTDGLLRDPWGQPIRYSLAPMAATPASICVVATPGSVCMLTVFEGIKTGMSNLPNATTFPAASPYLRICEQAACGNVLANDVAFVLLSGIDATAAGGADETENLDSDTQHVYHEPRDAAGTGGRFAHLVLWVPRSTLIDALARAGRL